METVRGSVLRDGKITTARFPVGMSTGAIVAILADEIVDIENFPALHNVGYSFDEDRVIQSSRGNLYSMNAEGEPDFRDVEGNSIDDPDFLPCVTCKIGPVLCNEVHTGPYTGVDVHEACIGHVDNVRGLCCGHGIVEDAYLAYEGGDAFYGEEALERLKEFNARL